MALVFADVARAFIDEFAAAVEALLGRTQWSASGHSPGDGGWRVSAAASGALRGSLVFWIEQQGAKRIAAAALGMDDADAAAVADLLRELCGQAAGALSLKAPYAGVSLEFSAATQGTVPPHAVTGELSAGAVAAIIGVGGDAVAAAPPQHAAGDAAPPAAPSRPDNLEVVLDIELPLVVRFARTVMPLKALSALGPGSIVDMERSPDEPVHLLVGERVIARGEVVVVGGNYGVRITDLISPAERVRLLEA